MNVENVMIQARKSQRGASKTIYQEPRETSLGAVAMTQNSNPVTSPGAPRRAKHCLVRDGYWRGASTDDV